MEAKPRERFVSLRGGGHGEEFVRLKAGEPVTMWTLPFMSIKKKGEMSFLADHEVLGEKFELIAVICMLGIMRRDHNRHGGGGRAWGWC